MKNLKNIALIAVVVSFLFSCEKKEEIDTELKQVVPVKVLEKFQKLGVNSYGTVPYIQELPDGNKESGWLSHDIFLSKNDIMNIPDLPAAGEETQAKLYRTNNLVRVPRRGERVITIRGQRLDSRFRRGLTAAVRNFNDLRLKFRLELSFGNSGRSDIVVFQNSSSDAAAVAGFPRNGNPFNRVELDRGARSLSSGLIEELITHELGHCFGLRHSDFRTRSSCNRGIVDEESFPNSPGAIYIPGTDRNTDSQRSVMTSCYGRSATGNFFSQDRTALRRLYR